VLRAARRYSLTAEDAEDAYQRGLEILLTKAPSTDEDDLVPWLKTVVKHEAFAIRRQREQSTGGDEALESTAAPSTTDEQAEQRERLRVGAEALSKLKPHEVQCLLLLAEGFTYKQICQATGWTYTKVNRCATEGRRAFRAGVEQIESGGECERLAPKLSALADGEATAEDIPVLRRHLRGCPACRVMLGEFRAVPARVAALTPPMVGVATDDASGGGVTGLLSTASDWVQERAYSLIAKAQVLIEGATAQKTAAVAASTVVLAGGGVGAVKSLERDRDDRAQAGRSASHETRVSPSSPALPTPPSHRRKESRVKPRATVTQRQSSSGASSGAGGASTGQSASATSTGQEPYRSGEFSQPGASSTRAASSSASAQSSRAGSREFQANFESTGGGDSSATRAGTSGEFGAR
jgi:RNA polymerase sigma factor (sigma-70 family)